MTNADKALRARISIAELNKVFKDFNESDTDEEYYIHRQSYSMAFKKKNGQISVEYWPITQQQADKYCEGLGLCKSNPPIAFYS